MELGERSELLPAAREDSTRGGLEGLSPPLSARSRPPWLSPALSPVAGQLAPAPLLWLGFALGRLSWSFQVQIPVATVIREALMVAGLRGPSTLPTPAGAGLASRHRAHSHHPTSQTRKLRHRGLQPLARGARAVDSLGVNPGGAWLPGSLLATGAGDQATCRGAQAHTRLLPSQDTMNDKM